MSATGHTLPDPYSSSLAELLLRAIDASTRVRHRHQFFTWSQSHLQSFLPHRVVVCGAYHRPAKMVLFDVYNVVPVAPAVMAMLRDDRSALMTEIVDQWIEGGGGCLEIDFAPVACAIGARAAGSIHDAGLDRLLVHGVARPHRPREVESLFVFAARDDKHWDGEQQAYFEMLLPHMHVTFTRVQVLERELNAPAAGGGLAAQRPSGGVPKLITDREREILVWVRDGRSNLEIGELLGISGLTVKNHVQKILRKLDASNRAQAVARAIAMRLIPSDSARRQERP